MCVRAERDIKGILFRLDEELRECGLTISAVNVDMRDNGFTYLSVDIPLTFPAKSHDDRTSRVSGAAQ